MSGSVGQAIVVGAAGQGVGSLVGPATEVGKGVCHCLKRMHDYIKHLGQNFENLEMEARYLSSRGKDVQELIDDNQGILKMTHECATWLEDVERVMGNVRELENKYRQAQNGCYGPCLLCTRLKLSKKIVKVTNSVINLRDRMNIDHAVRVARHPDRVQQRCPNNIIEVLSQHEHVEKLIELLKDKNIKKIGIWGMFGVGKTTILGRLNDEMRNLPIFDIVLWVKVSEERNLHKMQQEILRQLMLKTEDQSKAEDLISMSLEKKNYLLLLDGVFSCIDLHHLGFRDSHNCKVVLTTRERGVCNGMQTDEEIKVEGLSSDDAQRLFRSVVGDVIDHPFIKDISGRVLKQCGGLPHIIRAVGMDLKDKHKEHVWRQKLLELQSPNMFKLGHLEDVFKSFEVIFKGLNDILKECLLYAASFPQDQEIYRDYLIECWMAKRLISFGSTFRTAREKGDTSIDTFIDKCLFDRCRTSKVVKMPVIFRNSTLRVADQQNFGLLVKYTEERENPPVGSWTKAKVISLMNSDLDRLPDAPNCSMVSILFLQKNENLSTIPQSFFDYMSSLEILDLSRTSITSLPPSISKLKSLKGLYLNDSCNLVHLPEEIERLENLELLDICRIGIHGLGFLAVIGKLTCLRCLRVSLTSVAGNQNSVEANGTVLSPCNPIQQLRQLEELTIDADPTDPNWNMVALAILAEVARLEKLSTLSFYFPSIESLKTFTQTSISWKRSSPGSNFRSFNIYVGLQGTHNPPSLDASECSAQRYLYYFGGRDTPNVIKEVLKMTSAFELMAHQNVTNFSDFGIDEMEGLELCRVEGCNAMTIFLGNQMPTTRVFPWLRELYLLKLEQLNAICQGPITLGSFARLTILTIDDCPNLTEVLSWETAKQLCELQQLKVKNCARLQKIVAGGNQSSEPGAFPKLKTLQLIMLESIDSILSNDSFEWLELQCIEIDRCPNLANLCLSATAATKLRRIQCSQAWWQGLILNVEVKSKLALLLFYLN